MCLNIITSNNLSEQERSGTGYKVFIQEQDKGILYFQFNKLDGSMEITLNKWLIADNRWWIISDACESYVSGFHIFKTREAARDWVKMLDDRHTVFVIREIKYRKARLIGTQSGIDVIVADEMFVSSEVSE